MERNKEDGEIQMNDSINNQSIPVRIIVKNQESRESRQSSGVEMRLPLAASYLCWAPYLILLFPFSAFLCWYFSVVIYLSEKERSSMDSVFVPGALGLIEDLDSKYELSVVLISKSSGKPVNFFPPKKQIQFALLVRPEDLPVCWPNDSAGLKS